MKSEDYGQDIATVQTLLTKQVHSSIKLDKTNVVNINMYVCGKYIETAIVKLHLTYFRQYVHHTRL